MLAIPIPSESNTANAFLVVVTVESGGSTFSIARLEQVGECHATQSGAPFRAKEVRQGVPTEKRERRSKDYSNRTRRRFQRHRFNTLDWIGLAFYRSAMQSQLAALILFALATFTATAADTIEVYFTKR